MSVEVLEELEVFTPLGIRFWDPVFDRAVTDGLRVEAWPLRGLHRPIAATQTRSNVHVFRWLPRIRPVEHGYREPDFFDASLSLPRRRGFVVRVLDAARRFLPVAFQVGLPLPYRGLFLAGAENGSLPDTAPQGVHLFCSPTRFTGAQLVAVRGTLVDADTGDRAAWALTRVEAPHGRAFLGVADDQGRFSVAFPYPSLEEGFSGSPASFGYGSPPVERGWDIGVSVFYEPGRLTALSGTTIPEYRSILGQRQGSLWRLPPSSNESPEGTLPLRLPFGQDLVLRTVTSSVQFISPASVSP